MTESLEALPERVDAIERKLDALSSSTDGRFEEAFQAGSTYIRRTCSGHRKRANVHLSV